MTSTEKGHDRLNERTCHVIEVPNDHPRRSDWPDLRLLAAIISRRVIAGEEHWESRLYICSMPPKAVPLANAIRKHWSIDNSQHWVLDTAFDEDSHHQTRPQRRRQPRHHPPLAPQRPPPRHLPETWHQSQTLHLYSRSPLPPTYLPTPPNRCVGPGAFRRRLNLRISQSQIERLDIPSDAPHSMIRRNQPIDLHRSPLNLLPLRPLHPIPTRHNCAARNRQRS